MNDKELQEVIKEAEDLFLRKASETWFTAPNCNRVELRKLINGDWTLTLGSIGFIDPPNDKAYPVAQPLFSAVVDEQLLTNLAKIIKDFIPSNKEGSENQ